MLCTLSFREALDKWRRRTKGGKRLIPLYTTERNCIQVTTVVPRSLGDDVDCTQFPPQKVPMGYNPTELEDFEKDALTAIRDLWPELDNSIHSTEMLAKSEVLEEDELLNLREDPATNSTVEPDDATASRNFYNTIMEMDLATIFKEVLAADAVVSQNIEAAIDPVIAEPEDESENQMVAGEPVLMTPEEPIEGFWDCNICWENKLVCEFPNRTPSALCYHTPSICCKSCLEQSIIASSKTRYWDDIRCPACDSVLEYEDVKEFAPKELFEEYDKFALFRHLNTIPTFRFCTFPNCNFGQIHPSVNPCSAELAPRIVCSLCAGISCSKHDLPWHEGETCSQFDARVALQNRAQDRGSQKKVKKGTKACPNAECGRRIDKNGGCQHMTCLCRHEFCWDCLATYPNHKWTCRSRGHSIVRSRFARRLRAYLSAIHWSDLRP